MARPPKVTTPPWIDLKESLDLVAKIYDKGAGSVSYDDLAQIMDSTVKSSSFRMKTLALKTFGLVHTDGTTVRLTQLGQMIVAPSSQDERIEAAFKAFSEVQMLASLHQKYKGGFLPEDSFLGNAMVREFEVPADSKDSWVDCFKKSGRSAGILQDEGGKIRVLQSPKVGSYSSPHTAPSPPPGGSNHERQDTPPSASPVIAMVPKTGTFPIVLDETRSVTVPIEFNRDDLEYLQGVLELYVKKRESRKS